MLKSGLNSFERDCATAYKVSAQAGGNFKVKLFPKHFVENNSLLPSTSTESQIRMLLLPSPKLPFSEYQECKNNKEQFVVSGWMLNN